jgi:hypothetical protein
MTGIVIEVWITSDVGIGGDVIEIGKNSNLIRYFSNQDYFSGFFNLPNSPRSRHDTNGEVMVHQKE